MSQIATTTHPSVTGPLAGQSRNLSGRKGMANQQTDLNVGDEERGVSIAAGTIVSVIGLASRGVPGIICLAVGGALVYRGMTGNCSVYRYLGLDTAGPSDTYEI